MFDLNPDDKGAIEAAAKHLDVTPDWMEQQVRRSKRASEIADEIAKAAPSPIPGMTLFIMGNDIASGEEWIERIRKGEEEPDSARVMLGSFARMGGLLTLQEEGFISRDALLDWWPEEWPFADPDDTDPRFHAIWREAWVRNGRKPIRDAKPPKGRGLPRTKMIRVYRGQPAGAPVGCSWSLDPKTAEKFARGAWARMPVGGGEIIQMDVRRDSIQAYLVGRQESEVIIDPRTVVRVPR